MSVRRLSISEFALACLAGAVAVTACGCSMCCGPFDYHYPAFPGIVERADPVYGRVGSIYSDPYKAGTGPSADSNLKAVERKTPPTLDDLDSIPDAMPEQNLETPLPTPQEPMKIDRETRNPIRSRPVSPEQWR